MGIGGAIVTLSAGAVSLIVLPAVLVALGAAHQRARSGAPAAQRRAGGASHRARRLVPARARGDAPPGLVALGTTAVLIVMALPALRLQLTPADAHVLPSSAQPRQVAETITHDFAVDGSQTVTMVARDRPSRGPILAHRRRAGA